MLEMKNVTKTFGNFKALDDLTLTVPSGRVYGLVGPNGAGKSTAIRHLTGIYRPDSGIVTMDEQPIYENPTVKAAIGYIPDEIFYYPPRRWRICEGSTGAFTPPLTMGFLTDCTTYFSFPGGRPSAGFPRECRSRRRST